MRSFGRSAWGDAGQAALFGDAARWRPRVVWRRAAEWLTATRARRVAVRLMSGLAMLSALAPAAGMAGAATRTDAAGTTTIDAISWMNVRDSSGIALSDYVFATDHGSLLHPSDTVLSTVLDLEFAGFMALVVTAIWLIGYAISFRWLDLVAQPLSGAADALAGQVATTALLLVAATAGAFFVGWFVLRGQIAKATLQIVTMLAVAVGGVLCLAHPLADVLSGDGLVVQGRDVGLAVAAGLNGDADPNPASVAAGMQGTLADNFVRHPLQVWNFGHVVDDSPACRAEWSAGVAAGSDDRITAGMRRCGDAAAYAKAENPNAGQICTGLLLLLFGGLLLVFGVYLAGKIVVAAAEAIYHGFLSIFGFAAGGFVYGPTQVFLVRNVVDVFVAAAKMVAFTVYLAVYSLVLDDVFRQAEGHGVAVIFIGGAVMIVGVILLRRAGRTVAAQGGRITDRLGSVLATGQAPAPAGASMAAAGAASSGSGRLLTALAAVNTLNASPVTEYLMGRRRFPLSSRSRLRQQAELANMETSAEAGRRGWMLSYYSTREQVLDSARSAAAEHGHTALGAAVAVDRVIDRGGNLGDVESALAAAGFADKSMRIAAIEAYRHRTGWAPNMWDGDRYLGEAIASLNILKLGRTPANLALFQRTAHRLANDRFADPELQFARFTPAEQTFLHRYFAAPAKPLHDAIDQVATGAATTIPGLPGTVSADRAAMLNRFLNVHLSREYLAAAQAGDLPAAAETLRKMALPEYWAGTSRFTPAKTIPAF
ncbi:hypothetical protein [Nocardia aurantia]|uniref:Uncharacterized protein n=1 Tax=Nocardia aurantia TaxID=2585199 RepID=A0A7K0DLY4_9NOCA|nr:hypothetical protein [Nocardia aurantia]MQY26322.1 hypothetical protein [Nocardia aurantia]